MTTVAPIRRYSPEQALARYFELIQRQNWSSGETREMTASGRLDVASLVDTIRKSTGWSEAEARVEVEYHQDEQQLDYTAVVVRRLEKTDENA